MMRLPIAFMALFAVGPAVAATANFDSITSTTNYTSPPGYSENGFTFQSTFSNDPYVRIFATNPPSPYILACGEQPLSPCEDAGLSVLFPNATDSFSVDVRAADNGNSAATFTFSGPGGAMTRTATGFDTGSNSLNNVSFSGLGAVTSVVITNDDPAGYGFDNFAIDAAVVDPGTPTDPDTSVVPLPATGLLLLGAIAALGGLRRRSAV